MNATVIEKYRILQKNQVSQQNQIAAYTELLEKTNSELRRFEEFFENHPGYFVWKVLSVEKNDRYVREFINKTREETQIEAELSMPGIIVEISEGVELGK